MKFDVWWAIAGSSGAVMVIALLSILNQQREIHRLRLRLMDLIENYNSLLIVLRVHRPDIFGKIEPGEVPGDLAR